MRNFLFSREFSNLTNHLPTFMNKMIIFMNHFRSNTRKSRFYIEFFDLKVEFLGFHVKFLSFHEKFWIFKRIFEFNESLTNLHEQNDYFLESLSKVHEKILILY